MTRWRRVFRTPSCASATIAPLLSKLAAEFGDRVKIVKIDVDAEKEIAAKYQIDSIPSLLFFAKGQLAQRTAGLMSEASLRSALTKLASAETSAKIAS